MKELRVYTIIENREMTKEIIIFRFERLLLLILKNIIEIDVLVNYTVVANSVVNYRG